MMFFSTRDSEKKLFKASEVIKNGLASDGGLFVPDSIPTVTLEDISNLAKNLIPKERQQFFQCIFPIILMRSFWRMPTMRIAKNLFLTVRRR